MKNIWEHKFYSTRYLLTHPWQAVKDFGRKLKWAWQRTVRGYADIDWYNMDSFLLDVLPDMLETLARKGIGHPYDMSVVGWSDYLWNAAQHLRNADEEQKVEVNQYEEAFRAYLDSHPDYYRDKNHIDPDVEELRKQWLDRDREIAEWRQKEAETAFKMIGERFFDLWD